MQIVTMKRWLPKRNHGSQWFRIFDDATQNDFDIIFWRVVSMWRFVSLQIL
jgi:hypothetical protein